MIQIPIYRAKKIASDEWVEGYLMPDLIKDDDFLVFSKEIGTYKIDTKTLAIHFPWWVEDMFASFSKEGIGASIMQEEEDKWLWKIDGGGEVTYVALSGFDYMDDEISLEEGKVIGIHKG